MKIDCLVEITARFFYPGDPACAAELEDYFWDGEYSDVTKDWTPTVKDEESGRFHELEPAYDVEFTEEAIGFSIQYISEGRSDYTYCCGMDAEMDSVGNDWFTENITDFVNTAREIRAEYEAKVKLRMEQHLNLNMHPVAKEYAEIRAFRWIEAMGYFSTRDEYTGEYEAGVEFLGRVTLAQIRTVMK